MTEPLKLAAKLALARVKLGSLQPDKINKEQNYKYISADKILERGGDVLAELGIVIVPSVVSVDMTQSERQGKSPRLDAILKMSFQITDGETEYITYWTGCGSDYVTPDKAIYKAITSGHKYFLMKLLNVGVGNEDSEHEGNQEMIERGYRSNQPIKPTIQPVTLVTEADIEPVTIDDTEYFKAFEVLDSKGQKYGDKDSGVLQFVVNNEKTPPAKKQAAATILQWRSAHP